MWNLKDTSFYLLLEVKTKFVVYINTDCHVFQVVGGKELTKEEAERNSSVQLVSEQGCLRLILQLIDTVATSSSSSGEGDDDRGGGKKLEELHLSLVTFALNLWQHQRVLATAHLRRDPDFWKNLTWSLFDVAGSGRLVVNSR